MTMAAILVALIAVGFLLLNRHSIYRALAEWRAGQFVATAVKKIESGHIEEALKSIEAASQLSPSQPAVQKGRMLALMALRDPKADPVWIDLAERSPTPGNLIEGTRAAIACGNHNRAKTFLEELEDFAEHRADIEALRATLAIAKGDVVLAKRILLALAAESALAADGILTLSMLVRADPSSTSEDFKQDEARLLSIADQKTDSGLFALLFLASYATPDDPQRDEIARKIESHPLASKGHLLIASTLRDLGQGIGENLRRRVLNEVAAWPSVDISNVATWLLGQPGGSELVCELVPIEKAITDRALLVVRIQALALEKRWGEIQETLSRRPLPLSDAEIHAGLALAAEQENQTEQVEGLWQRAVVSAATDARQLFALAAHAEDLEWNDRARAIYERLTNDPRYTEMAFDGLARLASKKSVADALHILEKAAAQLPNSVRAQTNLAYARFLLNRYTQEDLQRAAKLAIQNRGVPAVHTALALGFLRSGNAEAALSALEELRIDWRTADAAKTAVYCAALAANSRLTEAGELVESIDWGDLRAEEQALVLDLKNKSRAGQSETGSGL